MTEFGLDVCLLRIHTCVTQIIRIRLILHICLGLHTCLVQSRHSVTSFIYICHSIHICVSHVMNIYILFSHVIHIQCTTTFYLCMYTEICRKTYTIYVHICMCVSVYVRVCACAYMCACHISVYMYVHVRVLVCVSLPSSSESKKPSVTSVIQRNLSLLLLRSMWKQSRRSTLGTVLVKFLKSQLYTC